MFKYYNPNLIVSCKSYTVAQICKLYAAKKLHPQTIRQWVKSNELEAVSKRPILIYGAVLKSFIASRNKAHKRTLAFDQFKCVKCRKVAPPRDNTISLYQNKNGSFKAVGHCPACNNQYFRYYKKIDRANLEDTFIINTPQVTTICDGSVSSIKTHLNNDDKAPLSEPLNEQTKNEPKVVSKTHLENQQLSLLDLGGTQ